MTTPNPQGSAGGVMQNELTMTQAAAGAFETAIGDLQSIYNQVSDANSTLGGAMISTSSSVWQQNTTQWSDDFYKLVGNLQKITDMLHQQITQMQSNEENNLSLTSNIGQVNNSVALP
jgi:uncharacterized protein YukE